jgi:ketosteroid isomerase-like protein
VVVRAADLDDLRRRLEATRRAFQGGRPLRRDRSPVVEELTAFFHSPPRWGYPRRVAGDTETTRDVIRRFYAAIGKWDEEGLRAVLHEDAELHQPPTLPYGGVYRGPDAMLELWKNVVLPQASGPSSLEATIVEGDRGVVVINTSRIGEPALAVEEYVVRDGRIARIRMFWFDPTPVAEAARRAAAG